MLESLNNLAKSSLSIGSWERSALRSQQDLRIGGLYGIVLCKGISISYGGINIKMDLNAPLWSTNCSILVPASSERCTHCRAIHARNVSTLNNNYHRVIYPEKAVLKDGVLDLSLCFDIPVEDEDIINKKNIVNNPTTVTATTSDKFNFKYIAKNLPKY